MFGAGTAWVLLAVTAALQPPVIDDVFVCRHVVAGLSGQLLSLRNGGSAVDWALRLVRWDGSRDGEVDALLASVPPGSDGVVCWPFLVSYGATDLEAGVRGGWVGLQLAHTMAHLLRAVVEGLAYELNRHLDFLRRAGIPVRRLVMCGGAASSRVTPQILADVTQLPLVCCPGEAGSVLGAAILARGLVTADLSLADLAGEMVPAGRMIEPGPDATAYAAGFRAYQDGLARLSPKG
jgi:sugar (pentulose or hexulose) kinase